MKKLGLLLIGLSLAIATQAEGPPRHGRGLVSNTMIYADGPFDIQVFVNGYLVNRRASSWVDLGYLRPGRHWVEVKAIGPRRTKFVERTIVVRPGVRKEFAVFSNGPRAPLMMTRETAVPIGRPGNRPYGHTQRLYRDNRNQGCGW